MSWKTASGCTGGRHLRARKIVYAAFALVLTLALALGLVLLLSGTARAGTVIYVDELATGGLNDGTSWTNAFTDLQAALTGSGAAVSGDEIWVAKGTYEPTSGTDRTQAFVLNAGVALYGGFAGTETARAQRNWETNVTTLSGEIGAPGTADNSYQVVVCKNLTTSPVLDGFTVIGGRADGTGDYSYGGGMFNYRSSPVVRNVIFANNFAGLGGGGGMANYLNSSPTLTNVTFLGNEARYDGGGMYNRDRSSPTLVDVVFSSNVLTFGDSGGAGMFNYNLCAPTLTRVSFDHNYVPGSASGGGVYAANQCALTLTDVSFTDNSAPYGAGMRLYDQVSAVLRGVRFVGNLSQRAALYASDTSTLSITDAVFRGNSTTGSYGGAMSVSGSSATVTNTVFANNTVAAAGSPSPPSYGGAVYNDSSSLMFTNVSFAGNSAGLYGGALYNSTSSASATLVNCILWGNSAGYGYQNNSDQIYAASSATVSYSIVEGGWTGAGTNNLSVDPKFVAAKTGDLHLQLGSPAIDAGTWSASPAVPLSDLDGVTRVGAPDMGAYEAPWGPTISTSPTDQTVAPGETATFTAAAGGHPTPTVKWQVSTDGGGTWSDISGATSTTYSFTAQSADNNKKYQAVFTGAIGDVATTAATLTVTKASATVGLDSASLSAPYDGGAHYASYTTDPATGVHVDVIYKQGATPVTDPTEPGSYDVTATINDPNYAGDPATGTLVISPPAGPQAAADTATVLEDSGANTIDVLANDSSAYTKTVTAVTQGSRGAVAITHAGADLSYTPNANYFGSDSFTYTMSDGHGGTSTAAVNVTCIGVNDAPSFTKGADQSVPRNSGARTVTGWATGISAGPNETSQTVDFVIDSNSNPGLFSAGPAVSATGTLTYTPAFGVTGSATIVLHVRDNGGTANGGVNVSATQSFTITVTSSTPPPNVRNDNVTVHEESGAIVINVLANDTGRYRLTITSVTQGAHGSVRIVSSGTRLAYTPAADFFGSDSFTYTASDGHGGTGTATVNVTIIPVNHAPSFTKGPDQIARKNSGLQTVPGWATNVSAGPNETGQTLSFSVSTNNRSLFLVQPAISSDGTLTYTPAVNKIGTATVTVTLRDNGGTAHGGVNHSAAQTFRISVCNRYDQSDTHLHYDGAWQAFSNAGAWLGNYSQSSAVGASVTIRFKGTRLDWVATIDTTMGSADVYVDGVKKATIDLAHDPAAYQQDVFTTGYLSDRRHTVTIVQSSGNAVGKFISIDAVDVVGVLDQAP